MNQRIKLVVNELKKQRKIHSAADCARLIGIDKAELSKMMSGNRHVSQRCVDNILTTFPEINEEWLRNGEGEMLKNTSAVADNHSISIAGDGIKENDIRVNTDKTIERLITEMSAQRKLTERTLEEIAAQRQLTEAALKQNSDLIAMLKGCK